MLSEVRWRPILEGELEARARSTVRAIGEVMSAPPPPGPQRLMLGHGLPGRVLLQWYLARAGLEGGSLEAAEALLDLAFDGAEGEAFSEPGLFAGFLGVGWVAALLAGEVPEEEDPNAEIDGLLATFVEQSPWRGEYELIHGLVGFGVYALRRLPRSCGVRCLEAIVSRLRELAEPQGVGLSWLTRPELLSQEARKLYPQGWYNLGVAHGVPGIVGLLGKVCDAGIALETARSLLEGGVAWLLAQRRPEGAEYTFPYTAEEPGSTEPQSGRTAWCYCDPGIACCLSRAARALQNDEWEQAALMAARVAARTLDDRSGVVDAGLCHGAAGLGHIYNRLFQATGEELFLQAARHWLRSALDMREVGTGVAGYRSWSGTPDGWWNDDPGFLTGAVGIGLALAAAVCTAEPIWDEALLMDLPPRFRAATEVV